ncbi:MAG: (Fe-S)-binding protein [Bacteroidota bacterium]
MFILVSIAGLGYAGWQFSRIRAVVLLGQDEAVEGPRSARWRNMLLVAFGQKKMFKRIIPAVLHFILYAAFVITQIELVEIFVDGAFGVHRFFAPYLGGFYTFIISFIEVLSFLAFFATFVFLWRRNALKIPRFIKPEMKGWPKLDANLILIFEIILLICIFTMNGTDVVLQKLDPGHYPDTGYLAISGWLGPILFSGFAEGTLKVLERVGWWGHFAMVIWFLNYLPKSKHLHILLAFPNTFYARLKPRGQMVNMPTIMNEVKSMMDPEAAFTTNGNGAEEMEELPTFGAHDIHEMSWIDILGAYTCTECGRCTAECPANQTGKKLSPRKIVMDVRDRATEVEEKIRSGAEEYKVDASQALTIDNFQDGKSLWDYITREEIHACTTCNACVEACPVLINPLEMINKLRRHEILMESAGPGDWLPLFNAIENSGAAWSVGSSRMDWTKS